MESPAIQRRDAFTVVGLPYRGTNEDDEISALWGRIDSEAAFEELANSEEWFGVCYDIDEDAGAFRYVAGVVADVEATVPPEMDSVDLPANEYAVFTVTLADLGAHIDAIYEEWLPSAPYRRADGPEFERYGPAFDGTTDDEFEYFVPVVPTE